MNLYHDSDSLYVLGYMLIKHIKINHISDLINSSFLFSLWE